MFRCDENLAAFGNRDGPRLARKGKDVFPDETGAIKSGQLPLPHGISTFSTLVEAPLTGHYHILPKGTELPDGLGVIADGADVIPTSQHPAGHHTIYPTRAMNLDEFNRLIQSLPWTYGGKK